MAVVAGGIIQLDDIEELLEPYRQQRITDCKWDAFAQPGGSYWVPAETDPTPPSLLAKGSVFAVNSFDFGSYGGAMSSGALTNGFNTLWTNWIRARYIHYKVNKTGGGTQFDEYGVCAFASRVGTVPTPTYPSEIPAAESTARVSLVTAAIINFNLDVINAIQLSQPEEFLRTFCHSNCHRNCHNRGRSRR